MANLIRSCGKAALFFCLLLTVLRPTEANARKLLPEEYVKTVQDYFADEQWETGKEWLDKGIDKYPFSSNLQWLLGKYWYHAKNYDQARFHLIKALEANSANVNAKQLLVDVEDVTLNYSSAICYVNELLEVNPYWRGLWKRKIELYRKQGNEVEAERLLKRINQIYPLDTTLRKDYLYTMEENYLLQKKKGNREKAIETLSELLKSAPTQEDYYLDITNLLLQDGKQDQALNWASTGVALIPGSTALVVKKASILAEMNRYPEALSFLQDRMKKTGNRPELRRLYNNLILDAARSEKRNDPYTLYGMAYENGDRRPEVINFLINTALERGYNDAALYYIKAQKKSRKADKELLYKEYLAYRSMGDEAHAYSVLQELYERYPGDPDLLIALCALQLQRANSFMEQELYPEALRCTRFVIRQETDPEIVRAAWDKTLACKIQMKQYDEAIRTLDTITSRYPDYGNSVGKRAFLLDRSGRTPEALQAYLTAIGQASPEMQPFYVAGYEDMALPYIKKCLDDGTPAKALNEAARLLELNPANDDALHYAINASAQLERHDSFRKYTELALTYYPDDPFYRTKYASVLDREQNYETSITQLRPALKSNPANPDLTGAHSQSSEYRALQLIREGAADSAIAVIDTALVYDRKNRSLLYAKGLAYEKKKQFDSAYYYYQKFEDPALAEQQAFRRHLTGLRNKTLQNEIGLEYLQSRYGEKDRITSIATVEYTRKAVRNTYTGRINYTGRDGTPDDDINALYPEEVESGGVGLQLQAEWTHLFSRHWQGMINAAWANRYFPKLAANVAVTRFLPHDWELELRGGYRRMEGRDLFSVGPGVAKFWGPLWVNLKGDLYFLDGNLYYNAMAQTRYFPLNDTRSYIEAMAGAGSAPELSVVDRALPGVFSHTNTMVGLGAQYLLFSNITVGLLGTWHTYYNQTTTQFGSVITRYKNLYNIYAQVYISF